MNTPVLVLRSGVTEEDADECRSDACAYGKQERTGGFK
jgi:hypothetical protein